MRIRGDTLADFAIESEFCARIRISDARSLRRPQQYPSRHVQIHQAAGGKESIGVLVQSPVANFLEAEDLLENQKRMLDLRSYPRLGGVLAAILIAQRPMARALLVREVFARGACSRSTSP